MEQKRKRCRRVSKMLVEAEPRYVSIVDHAANLTPFKDIKMEEPAVVETKETESVCKKELNFTTGSVVKEFVFGNSFKSEQDVKDYMEQNNWKGYTVSKVEGGYIAAGDYKDQKLVDEKIIPISDEVSVCVAKVEDATEKTETTEEKKPAEVTVVEKKAEEPAEYTQKYEAMLAYGNTLDEAIASGMDFNPMPVGFSEMFETFYNVLAVIYTNPEIVDKDAYCKKACADFADILVKLNALTASLLGSTDLTKKEAGENWLNAIKNEKGLKMAEQKEEIVEATEAPATEAAPAEPAEAPVDSTTPAAEEPAAETPAEQPEAQVEAPVAPAEPEAAPATEQPSEPAEQAKEGDEVAELRKSVEELRATIAELTSKAQKAEDSGADAEASPTKKSEMFENSGCASEEDTKKAEAVKAEKAETFRSQLAGFLGY